MTLLRRLAYVAVAVAFLHIVFGAIVRITGSGMGCGDHWPTCHGYWIPPFSRPDLVIEVTHRYLALLLLVVIAALAVAAWLRRREPGVAGRGGVLRTAGLAVVLWIAPALLGALTVFLGNPPGATVAHKALAAALLAVLAAAAVRAGGFGARALAGAAPSGRARRGAIAAASMAIVVVLLGGLTAKLPGAAVACAGFPLCTETSGPPGLAHVQLTHRVLAYLLALHLLGQAIGFTRRREPRPLLIASRVTLGLVIAQIFLAAHMVLGGFPAVVRSAHQATGMALWLTTFLVAYLAGFRGDRAPARAPGADPLAVPGPARTLGVVPTEPAATASASAAAAPSTAAATAAATAETAATARDDGAHLEEELGDLEEIESELDLEIAAELARREMERAREEEEREEFARAVALEMAKLAADDAPPESEAEVTGPESAALLAERLVVDDTPAFAEALEQAVEAAAEPEAVTPAEATPERAAPEDATPAEQPAAEQPGAASTPSRRKPLRLSMAVIVARGADL